MARLVSAGTWIHMGGVLSTNDTVWEAVVALPHASVAAHKTVTSVEGPVALGTESKDQVSDTAEQASSACAGSNTNGSPHSWVVASGTKMKVGGKVSITVNVWTASVWLPASSMAT